MWESFLISYLFTVSMVLSAKDLLKAEESKADKPVTNSGQCPQGWDYNSANNKCYYITDLTGTHNEMKAFCEKRNATLVIIHNEQEQDFISRLAKRIPCYKERNCNGWTGFHIGLVDTGSFLSAWKWEWEDGSPFDFNNWAPDEPNGNRPDSYVLGYIGGGSFADQNYQVGQWDNGKEDFKAHGACQKDSLPKKPSICPCPPGWTYYENTNKCFFLVHGLTYDEADSYCNETLGATLATVENLEENEFLSNFSQSGYITDNVGKPIQYTKFVFIGLYDQFQNRTWAWKDDSPTEFFHWSKDQPDNAQGTGPPQYCVAMVPSDTFGTWHGAAGVWDDYWCNNKADAICQMRLK